MITPSPPDSHYLWLGRVVSACSILEVQLGMIGWAAKTGEAWTEEWFPIAGSWSKASKLLEQGLVVMDSDLAVEVQRLLDGAKPLRDERNTYAHATFVLDPETTLPSHPWLVRTTRSDERALLSEDQGADLVVSLNRLSREASILRVRVADDFSARQASASA